MIALQIICIFMIKCKCNKNQLALNIILFIGMKTNLIKYPTAPITTKPIAHDDAILIYSIL